MGAHLITGYAGKEHITAADQGLYNAGTLGTGKYVLPIGSMFEASIITNNLVKIKDGCLVNQGRNINIAVNDYEECEIDNGIQALKRNDLIVIRYEKNADTGIETASTIVIKGVSGETAVDPEYTKGNIFNGDNVDDFPLYRVKLDGLNIIAVEPLFNTIVSFKTLADTVASLNKGYANLNTNLTNLSTEFTSDKDALAKHKNSSDHDSRYYTKTQNNTLLNAKQDSLIFDTYVNTETANSNGSITLGIDISGYKLSQKPKCAFLQGQHVSFENYIYSYDNSTSTLAVFVVNYGTPYVNTSITNRYGVMIIE